MCRRGHGKKPKKFDSKKFEDSNIEVQEEVFENVIMEFEMTLIIIF